MQECFYITIQNLIDLKQYQQQMPENTEFKNIIKLKNLKILNLLN